MRTQTTRTPKRTHVTRLRAFPLFGLLLATSASAALHKPVISCDYTGSEPSCTVDLVTAMNALTYREIEVVAGHKLTVAAAYNQAILSKDPQGLASDSGDSKTVLPLNPRITSDLRIIRIKYQPGLANQTASPKKFKNGRFDDCDTSKNQGTVVFPQEGSKDRIDTTEIDFEKVEKCDFVVTSVVLALPPGTQAPRDLRPKQDFVASQGAQLGAMFDAGRSMAEHLAKTRDYLRYLKEVLPTRMKPSAEAYSKSVESVLAALNFDPARAGDPRAATNNEVFEAARALYVHGSVLEAILNRNKSDLTNKYIDGVHGAVAQLAEAFGFYDGRQNLDPTAPKSDKIFGGPLSQGYTALMTAVDLSLQDAIMGLPVDPHSPEMRAMYDVQARAQAIQAMAARQNDAAVSSEIEKLSKAWSEPAFRSALSKLGSFKQATSEAPNSVASAYGLLASASESLASFSGLAFDVPGAALP